MIALKNVTKVYPGGTRAVDDVSLAAEEGEITGLIGTSGSGKTTTLKMINRLIEPTSGEILMNGESITENNPVLLRRKVGYVIQSVGLFPHMTIQKNLETVPRLLEWEEEKIRNRCTELMNLVGLDPEEYLQKYPAQLSGGQQQRIGLARAIAADPPVVLLDEPFGALDPITRTKLIDEFKELQNQIRKTMIMVTHNVEEAFDLCGKICLMDQGRLQQEGRPEELLFRPANRFVKEFFDSGRFKLELKSVTLAEIAENAVRVDGNFDMKLNLNKNMSVLEALEEIEKNLDPEEGVNIADDDGSTIQIFRANKLMELFYKVKKEKAN